MSTPIRRRQLQLEVRRAQREARLVEILRAELRRVFGPTLPSDRRIHDVVTEANRRLDGGMSVDVKPSVSLAAVESSDPEVRRLAARTVPTRYIEKLAFDRDPGVRYVAALRAPVHILDEMVRRWPNDDQLIEVAKERDLYIHDDSDRTGYKKLGDPGKQWEGPDLDDAWYETKVYELVQKYLNNIEYCWEELAVRQLAGHMKATSGVQIDEKKLLTMLRKHIRDREDRRKKALDDDPLSENPLKESIDWLRRGGHPDYSSSSPVNLGSIVVEEEVHDPVAELLRKQCSAAEFIRECAGLIHIRESSAPAAMRKYRLAEDTSDMTVPVRAQFDHGIRAIDEQLLDRYCKCWNDVQMGNAEPLRVQWNVNPVQEGCVSFSVTLR